MDSNRTGEKGLIRVAIVSATALFSMLGAGNAYFISKLVDKLESVDERVYLLSENVAVLKIMMSAKGALHGSNIPEGNTDEVVRGVRVDGVRLSMRKRGVPNYSN